MDAPDSRKMKQLLLEMLAWFHELCAQNGLRYYVLGGTMLGAVRHQGFIPWDDDIDIGLPYADYRRLEQAAAASGQSRYVLETPWSPAPDYIYTFAKVYDTRTTLVENTRRGIRRGLYLDIFPLTGMGQSEDEARRYLKGIERRRGFLLSRTTGLRPGRAAYKNAAVLLSRAVTDWFVDDKKYAQALNRRVAERDFDAYAFGGTPFGAWHEREIMPREVFGTPTAYPFETMQVFGPEQADAYLTRLYGNWRELPPPEKRVSHHDFRECDLERSYLRP